MNKKRLLPMIAAMVVIVALGSVGCQPMNTRIMSMEAQLQTNGSTTAQFHPVANHQGGLSLKFPGYILGIEKSPRETLGLAKNSDPLVPLQQDWFNLSNNIRTNQCFYDSVVGMLNDPKAMYISHIYKYAHNFDVGLPFIAQKALDNDYFDGEYSAKNSDYYGFIDADIKTLGEDVKAEIDEATTPYTHIFLVAMGWNTPQQESIKNFNSIMGHLLQQAPEPKVFKPLFIGITWPSEWAAGETTIWAKLQHVASYLNKAPDADEVGILIVNRLLKNYLQPIKAKHENLQLILIGHSFGARLITRSVFGLPQGKVPLLTKGAPDLVLSLQGAYSVRRFIRDAGNEGAPYADYRHYAKKFVATWSEHDSANPLASYVTQAHHIGGDKGFDTASKNQQVFNFLTVKNGIDALPFPQPKVDYSENLFKQQDWQDIINDTEKVTLIDASSVIKHEQWGNGGKAHSDIFTAVIARMIWRLM